MVHVDSTAPKLSIVKGNTKLGKGIWAFSTLPGNKEKLLKTASGKLITNIPGTCSNNCETCFDHGCYAVNAARRYKNVVTAWGQNTMLLRSGEVWNQIESFIKKKNTKYYKTKKLDDRVIRTFRINVSGEFETEKDIMNWGALAKKFPEIKFAAYTKNYSALGWVIENDPEVLKIPNFIINVSQWHGAADHFIEKYGEKCNFNIFEYDDSNKKGSTMKEVEAPHCPAVTKTGKHATDKDGNSITCDRCERCYRKGTGKTAVWSH